MSRKNIVLNKINDISKGESICNIKNYLGTPTFEEECAKKESPNIVGYELVYVFKQNDSRLLNSKTDEYIVLWFNELGQLIDIRYNNVEIEKADQ